MKLLIDELKVLSPKTKEFVKVLNDLKIADKKIAILLGESKNDVFLAGRNLPNVAILEAAHASAYDLIDCDVILIEKSGIEALTEQLMVK